MCLRALTFPLTLTRTNPADLRGDHLNLTTKLYQWFRRSLPRDQVCSDWWVQWLVFRRPLQMSRRSFAGFTYLSTMKRTGGGHWSPVWCHWVKMFQAPALGWKLVGK